MADYSNDIKRYLNGEMTPAEQHAFEKKALADPFLADAIDGAEQLSAKVFEEDIELLHQKINEQISLEKKSRASSWNMVLSIAASLVLLAVLTYLILPQINNPIKESDLAEKANSAEKAIPEKSNSVGDSSETTTQPAIAQANKPSTIQNESNATFSKKVTSPTIDTTSSTLENNNLLAEAIAEKIEREIELKAPVVVSEEAKPVSTKESAETSPAPAVFDARGAETDKAKRAAKSDVATKSFLAPLVVSGKVISSIDGTALPGVNVVIKGTTIGTVTDAEGNYQIPITDLINTNLQYSFIGLQSKEVALSGRTNLDVSLDQDATQLSEVVVTGYGTAKDEEITVPIVELAHPEIGNKAFKSYLENNVRYPTLAITNKIEGRVTVEFFVEPDSELSNFVIIKGIGGGCDEELIRLIKEGPKWLPTKKNNVAVRDKARIRFKFQLPQK